MQDTLPLSLEDAGALTPIVEQSAAELGSEASQQISAQPARSARPSGDCPCWIALKYAPELGLEAGLQHPVQPAHSMRSLLLSPVSLVGLVLFSL